MEYIKKCSLKRAFFILTAVWLLIGGILGTLSFCGLETLNRNHDISLEIGEDTFDFKNQNEEIEIKEERHFQYVLFFQIILPVLCIILAIVVADTMFYCMKIKKPIEILQEEARKIINNDLIFTIQSESSDELGELCTAFEKMRINMEGTIKTLWKEAEERRRLNAAFSHELKNPITILKGETAVLEKGIELGKLDYEAIDEVLSEMKENIGRIESHVENMSSARWQELTVCLPQLINARTFCRDLMHHINILTGTGKIEMTYDFMRFHDL